MPNFPRYLLQVQGKLQPEPGTTYPSEVLRARPAAFAPFSVFGFSLIGAAVEYRLIYPFLETLDSTNWERSMKTTIHGIPRDILSRFGGGSQSDRLDLRP